MRKILISLVLIMISLQLVSSLDILMSSPKELYNVGDKMDLPVTIKTSNDEAGFFQMFLLCHGDNKEFYREYLVLSAGEEKRMSPNLLLSNNFMAGIEGECKIKATYGEDYVLTNVFEISNRVDLKIKEFKKTSFKPGESFILAGEAIKATGKGVEGIVEATTPDLSLANKDTVNNGLFAINYTIPENTAAGVYAINIEVYEKDQLDAKTNIGTATTTFSVEQVPVNLEVLIENNNDTVIPGETLKVNTILHDQTGENIETQVTLTVKDSEGNILEQAQQKTGEVYELSIESSQPPEKWELYVFYNSDINNELEFYIGSNPEVETKIINKTLIVKNIGNVPYNDSITVKIGEETLNMQANLQVGQEKKYLLTAPDGEYNIEILTKEGNQEISEGVMLTGNAVDVREISEGVKRVVRHPISWIFFAVILILLIWLVYRKGVKRLIVGRKVKKEHKKQEKEKKKRTWNLFKSSKVKRKQKYYDSPKENQNKSDTITSPENKAELSLSLKGSKQTASLTCLKINNKNELLKNKEAVEGIIDKLVKRAESKKAYVYESKDYIFFLFAPAVTKTFKNQTKALELGQELREILLQYNKLAKQKISFGLSLNFGTIVAKKDQHKNVLGFMSLGNFMSEARKKATLSSKFKQKEVFLTKEINEQLRNDAKTAKQEIQGQDVFRVKEMKKEKTEAEKRFISNFLKGLEKDKK